MTAPVASFGGLASGVQWQDIIESTLAIDRQRRVTPLTTRQSLFERQRTAWNDLSNLLGVFERNARALRDGTSFGITTANVSASGTSGRSLLSATATSAATPGAYEVEVLSLAKAEKLGSDVFGARDTALGLAGDFTIAGQTVTIEATDTLEGIRDKINALNGGDTPTRVGASILQTGANAFRLVLTASDAGEAGIDLVDGTGGVARDLGFLSTESSTVSSATIAIAAAMGVSMPPPSTIRVGDQVISVDLTTDSLATIAARIRAAGISATVEEEVLGGGTGYRLVLGASVTDSGDANSQAVIDALGLAAGGRTAAREQLTATGALTDGGAVATGASLLTSVAVDGTGLGLAVGDTITIRGTRADGSTVLTGITVGVSDTMQTLVDRLNAADAFGGGSRTATATLDADGRIRLVDDIGGDSRLSVAFDVQRATGGPTTLGAVTTDVEGRAREIIGGSAARIRVDGVEVTSDSNTVTDAIAGVTMTLTQAEEGTTVSLTVARNDEAAQDAVEEIVTAYNDIVAFFDRQQAENQPLRSDPTLRSIVSSLTNALRTVAPGTGAYTRGANVGLTLQQDGKLALDADAFSTALAADRAGVTSLFGTTGIGGALVTASEGATRFGDGTIASSIASIDRQSETLKTRIQREEDRLEDRRTRLTEQFTRMEQAVARLQSQGSFISSQIAAANAQRQS